MEFLIFVIFHPETDAWEQLHLIYNHEENVTNTKQRLPQSELITKKTLHRGKIFSRKQRVDSVHQFLYLAHHEPLSEEEEKENATMLEPRTVKSIFF